MNDSLVQDAAPTSVYLDFMEGSRFWIQRVLVPIVVFVGILGNVVTAIVLTRRRMRSSTNVYLTALAASDLLYLVFLFSLSLAHYGLSGITADAYWTYWRFGLWLTDATSSTSIWLTVSFTVERYIAVCHPMRGKMLCTESRARKVTVLVYVLCFLSTFSTPFEWQTVRKPIKPADLDDALDSNITVSQLETRVTVELTELGKLHSYRTIFYWFSSLVFVILPLMLLVVFNSFLVLAVHKSQRQRRQLTQSERHRPADGSQQNNAQQENKITVTLIAVVVLFLICQSPTAVTLIYTSFADDPEPDSSQDHLLRGLGNIFNLLVAVNAACNFLLYCALSDKYRRTFAMTFLPRRCWARRDLRNTTVLGATSYIESPRRFSRSASLYRDNSPTKAEYLQVPLNGRSGAGGPTGPCLRRHQSAYIPRERQQQQASSPTSSHESASILGSLNRANVFVSSSRGSSECKLGSPMAESSSLLFELKNPSGTGPGTGTPAKLLCWKMPKRTKKDDLLSQQLKITVSDTEVHALSSV